MTEQDRKRRRRPRRIRAHELAKAIYIDFEGRALEHEPPILVDVLWDDSPDLSGSWTFTQYVFDGTLRPLADATGPPAGWGGLAPTLNALIERSNAQSRPLVGWSFHDRDVIRRWSGHGAFPPGIHDSDSGTDA